MLRFDDLYRLFGRINESSPNSPDGTGSNESKRRQPPIYIVGREKNLFLIARDDKYKKKTCIEKVETNPNNNTIERSQLYVHEFLMKCVCASLNAEKNILAFTTYRKKKEDQDGLYESYLVELEDTIGPNRFLFSGAADATYRSIQFIHDTYSKNTSSFFFSKDKERIELYNIETKKQKNVTKIQSQPEKQFNLVKSYLWMEWDPISSLLYFITISDQNETEVQNKIAQGAKTVDVLCEFKCRSFVDPRKPIRLSNFEFTLTITIPVESLLNRKDHYEHYPWRNGHCSPDTTLLFKVIRLSNNGICLCQQIPPSQQTPSTTVILYILHHHAKFTFNVPENHCKHRAFFSSLYDYLMVYIPGYC
ncbi:hypothetical protein AKO1_002842, partial [Acrasis kona]